jgi:hypothetical protein
VFLALTGHRAEETTPEETDVPAGRRQKKLSRSAQ